jgi:gamma-glutamyl-gamma-aminobutyrate hydrolase PuuD
MTLLLRDRSLGVQEERMGRPIIGITSELEAARWGNWIREAVVSPVSYTRAVERAGGAPVVLPPVPPESARSFVEGLAGLVFTGGRDVNPALYEQGLMAETDPPEHRRDRFELALMRAAIDADVPFLAIGRGMHILSVARGGTLTQHLPGHRPEALKYLPHDIVLEEDSQLGRLLGTRVQVPAAHHQAPDQPGTGITVAGRSPGGEVIEAIELQGHRFGVGVHWHPEESGDPRLLTALVSAATLTSAALAPKRDVQAKKVQSKVKAKIR